MTRIEAEQLAQHLLPGLVVSTPALIQRRRAIAEALLDSSEAEAHPRRLPYPRTAPLLADEPADAGAGTTAARGRADR